jgi:signal transduction histidine kinase/CheY-like chemotaxis protein
LQRREQNLLQHEVAGFKQSAMASIREAAWNYDWSMIEVIAASQINQMMTYIEICDPEKSQCTQAGEKGREPLQEYSLDILYKTSSFGEGVSVGTVYLQLHYQPFNQLFSRYILTEFITNGLGVFGVAVSIFLLFHLGAIRRLVNVASYTKDIDLTKVETLQPLVFDKKQSTLDEVDLLAEAMNGLIERMKEEFSRRKQLEQQLNHAQKMEALGTLAGGIAHDFNNILAAMLGYVQLCYDSAEEGTKTRRRLEQVLIAGERAKALIAQILIFSRKSENYTQAVCPAEIVEEALELVKASLPDNVTIEKDLDESLWIAGDGGQLHQVLLNLSSNAVCELSEHGGKIEVSLFSKTVSEQQAEALDIDPGQYVCLVFCDDGSGVEEEIRERIFDPFFTTKKTGKGTGMGLAVVHGIVQAHGGKIVLEPEVEQGTCFTLYFPQIQAAEKRKNRQNSEKKCLPGSEHLLLVDDEQIVAEMGRDMLESLGYRVSICFDPEQALQLLLETDDIDLLITDLTMPEMTGVDLARKLRQKKSEIPIVLYSGNTDLLDQKIMTDGIISQLLQKPFTVDAFSRVVRQALDG